MTNAEAAEAAVLVKATTRLHGAMEAYSDYIWAWLEHLESGAELHVEHCELGILLAQLAARPLLQWEKTLLAAQLERALAAKPHIPAIKQLLLDFEKADAVPTWWAEMPGFCGCSKNLAAKAPGGPGPGHQEPIVTSFESSARYVTSQPQQRCVFHVFVIQSRLSCNLLAGRGCFER